MEREDILLMIPGPVPLHPRVLRALSRPMIGHRSKEFGKIYDESRRTLMKLFETENEIFVITGSGTAAMEAALGNLLKPEDTAVRSRTGSSGSDSPS